MANGKVLKELWDVQVPINFRTVNAAGGKNGDGEMMELGLSLVINIGLLVYIASLQRKLSFEKLMSEGHKNNAEFWKREYKSVDKCYFDLLEKLQNGKNK